MKTRMHNNNHFHRGLYPPLINAHRNHHHQLPLNRFPHRIQPQRRHRLHLKRANRFDSRLKRTRRHTRFSTLRRQSRNNIKVRVLLPRQRILPRDLQESDRSSCLNTTRRLSQVTTNPRQQQRFSPLIMTIITIIIISILDRKQLPHPRHSVATNIHRRRPRPNSPKAATRRYSASRLTLL